jgi:predicted outer membrane lipoprotein
VLLQCGYDNVMTLVLWIVGAVMAMMFAIFTAMMFCDQYEGMTTDTTGIEAMKGWDELNVGGMCMYGCAGLSWVCVLDPCPFSTGPVLAWYDGSLRRTIWNPLVFACQYPPLRVRVEFVSQLPTLPWSFPGGVKLEP